MARVATPPPTHRAVFDFWAGGGAEVFCFGAGLFAGLFAGFFLLGMTLLTALTSPAPASMSEET
jgi:hypothetical protein